MKHILKLNVRVVIDSPVPLDPASANALGLAMTCAVQSPLPVFESEIIELLNWESVNVQPKPEPFDIWRSFDSVEEAVDYCKQYDDPTARMEDLAHHSIGMGEYGFTRDLLEYL